MAGNWPDELPAEQQLAVSYCGADIRDALQSALHLDAHLARLVAKGSEPILAQIRLAWWRDQLRLPSEQRATGEPILEFIGPSWHGREAALVALVDGWEELTSGPALEGGAIERFAHARAGVLEAVAGIACLPALATQCRNAGLRWALADFAMHTSNQDEQSCARKLASAVERPGRLPRHFRGIALLEGLATRSLRNGAPLLSGRLGALAALRLGLFGR